VVFSLKVFLANIDRTSMLVLHTVRLKCTLVSSHAALLVSHCKYASGTDRRTDARPIILRFLLDAA